MKAVAQETVNANVTHSLRHWREVQNRLFLCDLRLIFLPVVHDATVSFAQLVIVDVELVLSFE